MRIPALLAALALTSGLFAGCGVAFGKAPVGNEFFTAFDVTGDKHAGAPLTVSYSYAQFNPVPINIKCEVRQHKQLVKTIGEGTAPGLPYGSPKATPFPGNYSFDFTIDEPGTYKVQCYTPLDEDNFLEAEIKILPSIEVTPTPIPPVDAQ